MAGDDSNSVKKPDTGASKLAQLGLGFHERTEPDRNYRQGGRSFYFFDLDDNILHLDTQIFFFHKHTKNERAVSSLEYARALPVLGKPGPWEDFEINPDPVKGSFRSFRDQPGERTFETDLARALEKHEFDWKGPSWNFFYYAVLNQRPISIITARGHHPDTIRRGFIHLVDQRLLPQVPNDIGIYPVSHPETRASLGDPAQKMSIGELKKIALIDVIEKAMQRYGFNPYHRFGMSDDDPHNLHNVVSAMQHLKKKYRDNRCIRRIFVML
jgi:hypothetical protein